METIDPQRARRFATDVVKRLRGAGYEALWAGGCVRDQLMGWSPKDYDVATSARPEQVRRLFGFRRTLAVGESFGVVMVVGPKGAGRVEVATFRSDAAYSDGRHPDSVVFSTAEEDARRRDFTINGLFYDPLTDKLFDFVGGEQDLRRKIIRAIGDPDARIGEDKLRMLRAVRFATTLDFELDPATEQAIVRHAPELAVISGERISQEMRRLLVHPRRRRGMELIVRCDLLPVLLPELLAGASDHGSPDPSEPPATWDRTLQILQALREPTFSVALAVLLRDLASGESSREAAVRTVAARWRLSNDELRGVVLCHQRESVLRRAQERPWPEVQRILAGPRIHESLDYAEAVAAVEGDPPEHIAFCRSKLSEPEESWNPQPLITGYDLENMQIPQGPIYAELLDRVRDAQLLREVSTADEAKELVKRLWTSAKEQK